MVDGAINTIKITNLQNRGDVQKARSLSLSK